MLYDRRLWQRGTHSHPHRDTCKLTDDSQRGRAWRGAGWAGQSWGRWGGTVFAVSPTFSYTVDQACLFLPRWRGDGHTNHTDGPPKPRSCLAPQARRQIPKKKSHQVQRNVMKTHRESKQPKTIKAFCVCWQVHPYKYRWVLWVSWSACVKCRSSFVCLGTWGSVEVSRKLERFPFLL